MTEEFVEAETYWNIKASLCMYDILSKYLDNEIFISKSKDAKIWNINKIIGGIDNEALEEFCKNTKISEKNTIFQAIFNNGIQFSDPNWHQYSFKLDDEKEINNFQRHAGGRDIVVAEMRTYFYPKPYLDTQFGRYLLILIFSDFAKEAYFNNNEAWISYTSKISNPKLTENKEFKLVYCKITEEKFQILKESGKDLESKIKIHIENKKEAKEKETINADEKYFEENSLNNIKKPIIKRFSSIDPQEDSRKIIESQSKEIKTKDEKINELGKNLQKQLENNNTLQDKIKEVSENLQKQLKEVNEKEDKIKELRGDIIKQFENYKALQDENKEVSKDLQKLLENDKALQKELDENKEKNKKLEEALQKELENKKILQDEKNELNEKLKEKNQKNQNNEELEGSREEAKNTTQEGSRVQNKPPKVPEAPLPLSSPIFSGKKLGLPNIGNTCYFNSVLQALASNNLFVNFVRDIGNESFSLSLYNVFASMREKRGNIETAVRAFKDQVNQEFPFLDSFGQQDSKELLSSVLSKLEELSNRSLTNITKNQEFLCLKCRKSSQTQEIESFFVVPHSKKNKINAHIQDLIAKVQHFRGDNMLYCQFCDSLRDMSITIKRIQCSEMVIIYLPTNAGSSSARVEESLRIDGNNYSLYGVICYYSFGRNSGHYTAYTKDGEIWRLYNDSGVTDQGYDVANSYLAFYHKIS